MDIQLKRIYTKSEAKDGYRVLVDRLWPRGISKENAHLNEWNKNLAPSDKLRKWFRHDPNLWNTFSQEYRKELESKSDSEEFLNRLKNQEKITLIYAAKDKKHCHPLILKSYLEHLIIQLNL